MDKVTENPLKNRQLAAFVVMTVLMVTFYLTANVMAVKLISVCGVTIFDAGTIVFPITYMLGDVFTEMWGFKTTRKVVFLTFLCQVLFTLFAWVGTLLPYPEATEAAAQAYGQVFTFVPRIMGASLAAFLVGELMNAWSFDKIKRRTQGRHLWLRTIGSSLFGFVLDTTIFVLIAFWGVVPAHDLLTMVLIQIGAKMAIEACASTPLAYLLVARLRQRMEL